jgi:hypothetical protein
MVEPSADAHGILELDRSFRSRRVQQGRCNFLSLYQVAGHGAMVSALVVRAHIEHTYTYLDPPPLICHSANERVVLQKTSFCFE